MSIAMTTQSTPLQTRKRKGGRPHLPSSERRDFQYKVGYKEVEVANLEHRAQSAGLPVIELIRYTSLGAEIPRAMPQVNKQALAHLGKIGSLFNQIGRSLNSGIGNQRDLDNLEIGIKALVALQTRILDAEATL